MENRIRTRRGTFRLVKGDEIAELKKAHYGYHHEHNGYVVLGDGRSAVAVTKEDYKKFYWQQPSPGGIPGEKAGKYEDFISMENGWTICR